MPTNLPVHPTSTIAHPQLPLSLIQKGIDYHRYLCLFIDEGKGRLEHAQLAEQGKLGATSYPMEHPVQIAAISEWNAFSLKKNRRGEGKRKTYFGT